MSSAQHGLLLLLAFPGILGAQPCARPDLKPQVEQVKAVQSQLLAFKMQEEIDESVPAPLQAEIGRFKDAFAALGDAALACAPADVDPKTIETEFAKPLDANKPVVQEVYDPKKPPQLDQIYGADLTVKVSRPQGEPRLLLVDFGFGIDCGDDNLLLAYEYRGGFWKRALRWQSPAYDSVKDAFGDFFDYVVLPESEPGKWRLAVAHGSPWCSSRWSGFGLDLIESIPGEARPTVLQHIDQGYVRFEIDPVLKVVPDGFQLRLETGMIDMGVMTRVGIYRYRVDGSRLERIQPIALNGRDFVDEWIQSPWGDAARWSTASNLSRLQRTYGELTDLRNSDHGPLLGFGPVRGCSDSKAHFQVELDEDWVDDKGKSSPGPTTYFQIAQGKNSFTMLSASSNADPKCAGADIMPKQ
jgi:hypothetical protein